MRKEDVAYEGIPFPAQCTDTASWDLRLGMENERLMPIEDLKEVQIGHLGYWVIKIATSFPKEEEQKLVD